RQRHVNNVEEGETNLESIRLRLCGLQGAAHLSQSFLLLNQSLHGEAGRGYEKKAQVAAWDRTIRQGKGKGEGGTNQEGRIIDERRKGMEGGEVKICSFE
ncbi:hypothetical protein Vretimale_7465, partial [Volvox reticuliferus]